MGLFSDIGDFLFGWLTPDLPKAEIGIDVTVANTDAYIPVAYGRCYGEGLLAYQATNDADNDDIKNDLLHRLVIWSEGECGGIIGHYADDEISTSSRFDAEDGGRWLQFADFNNGMGRYLDPHLAASGKRATDTFDSKQISYIRCEMTPGDVWSGTPTHMAEYRGRLISTPSGGAKTSSENPVDQLYDLLRSPIYGKGLTTNYIDVASFQSERSVCATQVETFNGSGVYRSLFTSNIILDTSNTVLDNVNTLLKAMRGWLFHSDGKLKLLIEKDDPPVDFALDESDRGFIEWGNVTNSSKSNRYNRVICRYTDPDSGWTTQEVVYPEAGSDEEARLLAEDNGVLLEKSITLDTCIYYHEAAQHAKTILLVSREQLRTSVEWGPEAVILEVGDIVPVIRKALGWDGKLFRIESTEKSTSTGRVELKLREHQPYIYDDANVGDKPVLPDTNISYSRPAAPTNLELTDVYDDFIQVKIKWDSGAADHRIVIANSDGTQILNSAFSGREYSIENYSVGTYSVKLYAIGGLGRTSLALDFNVVISTTPTPTDTPSVTSKPGFITIMPPLPNATKYDYEWRWATSDDATNIPGGTNTALTISDVVPGIIYAIEYRLITPYGAGDWELVLVNALEKLTYIWYVYATSESGADISRTDTSLAFFGIAAGKLTATVDISDPSIFDYYPNPTGGITATSGIVAQLDNGVNVIPTDAAGNNGDYSNVNSTLSILVGTTDDTASWTISVIASSGITGSLSDQTYTVADLSTDVGVVTFTATRNDYPTFVRSFNIAKVKGGADGPQGVAGPSGTTYTWIKYATSSTGANLSNSPIGKTYIGFAYNKDTVIESDTPSDYEWALIQGEAGDTGVPGTPGADGTPRYTWIKYAASSNGTTQFSDTPTSASTYIGFAANKTTASESNIPSDYAWSKFKGEDGSDGRDGADGPQGVPGTPGADGTPRYTWIKYATSSTGANLSNSPIGKTYIGFAYNKTTATESTSASQYTWSLIRGVDGADGADGADGLPGPDGEDGTPRYIWVKYADSATGSGLSNSPTGKAYIGIAPNKTTATESTSASQYTWSLIRGVDGADGPPGPPGPPGTDSPDAYVYRDSGSFNYGGGSQAWRTILSISTAVSGNYDLTSQIDVEGFSFDGSFNDVACAIEVQLRSSSGASIKLSRFPSSGYSNNPTATFTYNGAGSDNYTIRVRKIHDKGATLGGYLYASGWLQASEQ